ncbi:divergent polysaccharide deacetylase family protein [Methylobacterium sp. BTF04]|uniref:divergent polysaccharide deacetylase family protein n=1 Tax=Methylobacterium sp. BTF04 TaxID=2708300 RepID=UPI0032B2DCCC
MAFDDILTRPLGAKRSVAQRLRAFGSVRLTTPVIFGILAGGLVIAGSILVVAGDPQGGEPRANVAIAMRDPAPAETAPALPERDKPVAAQRSANEVESASGVVVVRPSGTAAPTEAVVIRVPDAAPVTLAPAPDPRLVERGRHGNVPRMGEGRLRPLDVYARPDAGGTGPRIAILVSGLGIGQAATVTAITRLPPAVSLAFAPYGSDLERTVARARDFGHEALLQAPMEPFDYPDSDPGPQTLLTTSRPSENLDRLSWAMSRFSGFVGIVNYMGAKLTSDAVALEPVLREIAGRGLGYVDDGTSPRSLAAGLAAKAKLPVARAEIVLDAVPRPEAIDRELARLEAQARANGFALASASALPMSIDRIARWAREAEARGIRLVPVSVALRGSGAGARLSSAVP